ncbi:hypothetical protein [Amycolatopsis anabasis]|uniref:hypothetical protein n=1 Tax=Amycolatopsis anabasis TaxID=1840409 RepID=UPI00131EA771|nr:hypothetical protein [Amycolatopsis anabasis]
MDPIADKVTPKVNRKKGKDVAVGDVIPMRRPDAGTHGYGREWRTVAEIRNGNEIGLIGRNQYAFFADDGWMAAANGHEYVQVHS